jgi:hypothetical protein
MRATRLSVANYHTTLSSDSLESGTGSSNSLRSATQSYYRFEAFSRDDRKKPAYGVDALRPTGTGESSHVEACRVTSIFSLWARNSVPMP